MTEEEIRSLRTSTDRETRRKSYESLRQVYNSKQAQITLGNIYAGIVKDWTSDVKLRGYQTIMEPRNTSEELENEVVDMLMQEVQTAYPLFARFIEAKQKLMKLDEFHIYDVSAPLGQIEKEFSFEDGTRLHLETMKDFDQEFYDYSVDMLESGRIDAFPKYGKRSGAFASYGPGEPSFVLLNHTGKLRDVSTLSHELGHATHGHLSQGQKSAVYGSPLSLAETASIFSEMLLSEKIRKELSTEEYKEFLNEKLSDTFATIFRQIQYIVFEKRVHEAIFAGQELTYHDFNRMWREEQIRMTGESIAYDVTAENESSWSMIPHIFASPFYCYAYAFGNILVFALYNRYQKEGQSFVESYKNILRSGGSKRPKDLLAEHGFDITSPKFYRDAMEEVEKMVMEFEGLVEGE
jgi:oligoendopeptidase F